MLFRSLEHPRARGVTKIMETGLRADDFEAFFAARSVALLERISAVMRKSLPLAEVTPDTSESITCESLPDEEDLELATRPPRYVRLWNIASCAATRSVARGRRELRARA